jgi:alginate biosynthesis protein Alg44
MNPPSQTRISHESETQRQHARLALPCHAVQSGREYAVKNLSAGGLCLAGVEGVFTRGRRFALELRLPCDEFTLGVPVQAEVRHHNPATKTLNCCFESLGPEQVTLLNHALKSFMAGHALSAAGVLNAAARDNFTKARAAANRNAAPPGFLRQLPGLLAVLAVGALIIALVGGNLYNSLFVVKSSDAAVAAPAVAVRAPSEGVYRSRVAPDFRIARRGETLGTLTSSGRSADVVSPCDCYVLKTLVADGEFASQGAALMSLIPVDATPWVVAEVDPAAVARIPAGARAEVSVFGNLKRYAGRVAGMESGLAAGSGSRPVTVKVLLDRRLPVEAIGRPASVVFNLR